MGCNHASFFHPNHMGFHSPYFSQIQSESPFCTWLLNLGRDNLFHNIVRWLLKCPATYCTTLQPHCTTRLTPTLLFPLLGKADMTHPWSRRKYSVISLIKNLHIISKVGNRMTPMVYFLYFTARVVLCYQHKCQTCAHLMAWPRWCK